jgi:hypothetical protein
MNQSQLIEAGKVVVRAKSVIPVHAGQHKMLTDEGFQHVRNTGDHSTYVSPKGGLKIRTRGNGFMTAVPNKK